MKSFLFQCLLLAGILAGNVARLYAQEDGNTARAQRIYEWLVANEGRLTVALDINITKELREEGIARELINRIQNLRKDSDFNVTDKIHLQIGKHEVIDDAVEHFKGYIAAQVLAESVDLVEQVDGESTRIEIDDIHTFIRIEKIG